VVKKSDLADVAANMESFVQGNLHTAPGYLDHWATLLRSLIGEKVDLTYLARGRLDAIVDAHDRAESVNEDIAHFNKSLQRALGLKDSDFTMSPEEKARQIVAVIGATGRPDDPEMWKANIATAIREAVAEEREACAKAAEALKDGPGLDSEWYNATAKDAAKVIRSRQCQHTRLDRERMAPDGKWMVQCLECRMVQTLP
jgi:hypothetical protein